jgi:hypothetical protein
MNIPSKPVFFLCVAMAGSAMGAPPPALSDAPIGAPSDFTSLSASARLGLRFGPAAQQGESTFVVTQVPDSILLPRFFVKEPRVRLTETDILTDKAKLRMAQDRYLSPLYRVTFGPMAQLAEYYFNTLSVLRGWHPNEAEAMTLYRQDERLGKLAELNALIGLETLDNAREAKQFQKIQYDALTSSR